MEADNTAIQQFVKYTSGQIGATDSWNSVGVHVNRPLASKGITVGDPTTTLGGMLRGNQI